MQYHCANCGYIYDEALGEEAENISAGTKIDEIFDEVGCPGCEGSFEEFSVIEQEVLYPENMDALSGLEYEHIPKISYQDEEKVEVFVGDPDEYHPSGEDHRITALYLLDEDEEILEEVFIKVDEDPTAEFDIAGLESFYLRASCSEHGLWSTLQIQNEE